MEQDEVVTAVYEVDGPEMQARARAERICLDQTIEADADLLALPLRGHIVGRLEDIRPLADGGYEVTINYAGGIMGQDCSDLLNIQAIRPSWEPAPHGPPAASHLPWPMRCFPASPEPT